MSERVAGVEGLVVALDEELAVQLVGAGLGENLDAPVAQPVELGGKGILVDANLADRRLGRKLPAAEAVDINLPAVRSSRGSGQRRQLVGQFIGIVGERVQVLALEDDGAGVAAGLHVDRGDSSVTITLCCSTSMAMEMSTRFTWPAAS